MSQVDGSGGAARDEGAETDCAKENANKWINTRSEIDLFIGRSIATILQSFGYNLHIIVYFRHTIQEYHMNRLLRVVLILLLLLSLASVYIFIPRVLLVTSIVSVKCNPNGAARILGEDSTWQNRWQGRSVPGYVFHVKGKAFHEMDINIKTENDSAMGRLTILNPGGMDSVALQWRYSFETSLNPFRRVQQYRQAFRNKHAMDTVLAHIRIFLEDNRNIYGIHMMDSMSKDSALLVMRLKTAEYPSTEEIYRAVAAIRAYTKAEGAQAINYPMLHVSVENGSYESMVALSVDRKLKGTGLIAPKRYVPWKIVVGEVRGGVYSAEQAMVRLQEYVSDHQKPAMGLPFQSLVTERDREPDTARWVTQVVQAVP